MPVIRYELTDDIDDPVVVLADDLPLLDEGLAGSLMYVEVAKSTGDSRMSTVVGILRAQGAYDECTGRLKLFDARSGRDFMNRLLRREKCKVRYIRNRGGQRVSHPERDAYFDHMLTSMRAFLETLYTAEVLGGQRALDVDGWHLLDASGRARFQRNAVKSAGAAAAYVRETGRYYRSPYLPWFAPRTSDTRWLKPILEALRAANKHDCVIIPVEMAGCTAARIGEILDALIWDWWRASKFGNEIFLRNKGGGEAHRKRQHLSDAVRALLLAYINGGRLNDAVDGLNMETLVALGKRADRGDREAIRKLKSAHLIVNTRGDPMTYDNLRMHVTPVMRKAGIPATLHWIRHEYVFRRLREIDAMKVDAPMWHAERYALAKYMGWRSGTAMFEVYDAFERERRAHAGAAEYADRLDREVTASQRAEIGEDEIVVAPLVHDEECAEFSEFMSDNWLDAANDQDFGPQNTFTYSRAA